MNALMISMVLLTAYVSDLPAQNNVISWSALDMGYVSAASPTATMFSIAGQVLAGSAQTPTMLLTSGFLAGLPFDTTRSSAGGGVILYSRSSATGGTVWMRSMDGTVDTPMFSGSWPRLSHNGRYVIFHKGTSPPNRRDINLFDRQTGEDTLLFQNVGDYINTYDWLDDDYHLVFDYSCSMMMMNRDRTGITALFQVDCYDDAPVVRPGSRAIAFHNAFQGGILLTDSLGLNRHSVPNAGAGVYWPAWSPDGQWISFGTVLSDSIGNYWKIHPDGSGLTPLTSFVAADPVRFGGCGGAWTPDGSKLLVVGRVRGVAGIYAIATDGSGGIGLVPTTPDDPIDFVGSVTGNLSIPMTDVRTRDMQMPANFRLNQNYPNPFNPTTTIKYDLPKDSRVTLKVFDILGREVAMLVNEEQRAGFKFIVWNGAGYASGVYFYRLRAGDFTATRKLLLLR